MKTIQLTKGQVALVDDEWFSRLSKVRWMYHQDGYAYRVEKGKNVYMHRVVLNAPKGKQTDHIDNNRLNNQAHNLRLATGTQNNANRSKLPNCTSNYRGVCWYKKDRKWVAQVTVKEKTMHLGQFTQEHHAAMVYDIWAKEFFGSFAKLNFPQALFG